MSTAIMNREDLPSHEIAHAIAGTLEQLKAIRTFIEAEFDLGGIGKDGIYRPGVDAGKIPGCGDKETLFLPGAQKAVMYFGCYPTYKIRQTDLGNGHVEYRVRCMLISRALREQVGEGVGSCSSMESKYRYRKGERVCPACKKPSIIKTLKGRNPGGYWCVPDKGGCGANFNPGDRSVEGQETGKVENPDIADLYNTVLKMGKKRAFVDAAMTLACLSELFTQDIEDTYAPDSVVQAAANEIIDGQVTVRGEVVEEYKPTPPAQNNSGHGRGSYASPEQVKSYGEWMTDQCVKINAKWHDEWNEKATKFLENGLGFPTFISDVINPWQANGHLLKWGIEVERLDRSIVPEETKSKQAAQYVAIVFHRSSEDRAALKSEMGRYLIEQRRLKSDTIYRKNPELAPEGWAEEQQESEADRGDAWEDPSTPE